MGAHRQWLPVIIEDPEQGRIAAPMQWGFIPPWSTDPSKGPRPINTKAETVFDIRMCKGAVDHHPCLVPTRGFYEWKPITDHLKVPYFILPNNQASFASARIPTPCPNTTPHPT